MLNFNFNSSLITIFSRRKKLNCLSNIISILVKFCLNRTLALNSFYFVLGFHWHISLSDIIYTQKWREKFYIHNIIGLIIVQYRRNILKYNVISKIKAEERWSQINLFISKYS